MSDDEFIDPLTGECVDTSDVDTLLESYQRLDRHNAEVYGALLRIRRIVGDMVSVDSSTNTKTRRVRGKRMRAVVTMPDEKLDQPQLKSTWNAFPDLRDQVLKIGVLDLKKREWNKMKNESGPPDFEMFKKMITAAILTPTGLPRIEIESDNLDSGAKQADTAQELHEERLF